MYFPKSYQKIRIDPPLPSIPNASDVYGAHLLGKLDWSPYGNSSAKFRGLPWFVQTSQAGISPVISSSVSSFCEPYFCILCLDVEDHISFTVASTHIQDDDHLGFSPNVAFYINLCVTLVGDKRGISQVNVNCRGYVWILCFLFLKGPVHLCQTGVPGWCCISILLPQPWSSLFAHTTSKILISFAGRLNLPIWFLASHAHWDSSCIFNRPSSEFSQIKNLSIHGTLTPVTPFSTHWIFLLFSMKWLEEVGGAAAFIAKVQRHCGFKKPIWCINALIV